MARRSLFDVPSREPAPKHDLETPDFFADTRMPFGEHLEVLRKHLWKAVLGFLVTLALVFGCDFAGYTTGTRFGIGRPAMAFIARPVEQELQNFYRRRVQNVLANLEGDSILSAANGPTEFFRVGLLREQILA
ncbi:MAG TPA: hypothetical protein VGY58_10735, partial [Gemmataceae bacterium]|nr:hypothetical protein [Gemmataceae bacterium]